MPVREDASDALPSSHVEEWPRLAPSGRPRERTAHAGARGATHGETRLSRVLSLEPLLPRSASERRPAATPPELPSVPHRAARESVRATPRDSRAGADETREVHVSIGTIEVTAVHEAPAPKPRRAPRPQPMSLADYLARRERPR